MQVKKFLLYLFCIFVLYSSLAKAQNQKPESINDLNQQELNNPKPVIDFVNDKLNKTVEEANQKIMQEIKDKNLSPSDKEYRETIKKHFVPIRSQINEFRNTLEKIEHKFALDALALNLALGAGDNDWVNEILNNSSGVMKEELVLRIAEQYVESGSDYDDNIKKHLEEIKQNSNSEENKKTAALLLDPFFKNPVGLDFPDFPEGKTTTDGKPLTKERFKGKILLVDFWATWCPPCRAEVTHLVDAYKEYKDKGFEIVGISYDKDKVAFEKYLKENNIEWPQYFDGKGWQNEVGEKYFVRGIPKMYLLDRDGKVIAYGDELRGKGLKNILQKLFQDKK